MKVLLVAPFLPHRKVAHAGGRFVYWLAEELGRRVDLCLLTRVSPGEEQHVQDVRSHCREVRCFHYPIPLWGSGHFLSKVFSYVALGRMANAWLEQERFDLVQVEHVETGFAIHIPKGVPAVIDCHDVLTKPRERIYRDSRGIPRIRNRAVLLGTRVLERHILEKFSLAFVRSSVDEEYFRGLRARIPVRIVPHPCGLDLMGKPRSHDGRTILFFGAMHRPLNVEAVLYFANEIFPRILERVCEARFVIAGANPPDIVRGLAREGSRIEVLGRVDDLEGCYVSATVFVSPILVGGGIIVKILDAMAAGIPVVTTKYGNEGIGAMSGEEVLVADATDTYADAVVRLLSDPEANRRIGERGRDFVRGAYSAEAIGRIVLKTYRELLSARCSEAGGTG